tara:strand:+ start:1129 stop:2067 length:939 start_codon:yes stop_codon:yes gene_type:complete
MAIPTYDKLFRPVLEIAARERITRSSANAEIIKRSQLTQEEIDRKLSSGGSTIRNRTGWAMTFLTKAALIEKVAPKTYQATALGHEFLAKFPHEIGLKDLRKIPGYEEAWKVGKTKRDDKSPALDFGGDGDVEATATPDEIIEREVAAMRAVLRDRLLKAILDQTPEFFEKLVLDVLVAMGYGGSLDDAAQHVGRTGDEGIDGRINQDALGLDQILVQAKRYHPDNLIGRPAIQAFIGSMAGQGVAKGIFITTSSFGQKAEEFVLRGSSMKIVLVDGDTLIDLMLRHGIGARVAHKYEVHELDQNYFEDSSD